MSRRSNYSPDPKLRLSTESARDCFDEESDNPVGIIESEESNVEEIEGIHYQTVDGERRYFVDFIVTHRINKYNGDVEYLTRFKHYGSSGDSWLRWSDFANLDAIETYKRKLRRKKRRSKTKKRSRGGNNRRRMSILSDDEESTNGNGLAKMDHEESTSDSRIEVGKVDPYSDLEDRAARLSSNFYGTFVNGRIKKWDDMWETGIEKDYTINCLSEIFQSANDTMYGIVGYEEDATIHEVFTMSYLHTILSDEEIRVIPVIPFGHFHNR